MSINLLVSIVITLMIMGLILWLIQTYVLPIVAEPFRTIIIVVLVICIILWLLSLLQGGPYFHLTKL